MAHCILYPTKICNHCGECDNRCELNPKKICDNCFRCLDMNINDYANIDIDKVITDENLYDDNGDPFGWDDGNLTVTYHFMTLKKAKGRRAKKEWSSTI